jgi:choice-of-anchor B domain-containing protein
MMMKKISSFIPVVIILVSCMNLFSQLPDNNMRLLAARNDHSGPLLYSAVWGYAASNGREYAILGCSEGTAFYDITDTNNVRECGFIPGLSSYWREFKTFSHYAYIVSEAEGSGLQIVDLQYLPDSVRLVNTFLFEGFARAHTISQSGPYLYLNGGSYGNGGIFILDLSINPEIPVKRGEWETEYVHDCRVQNDTVWAASIFDGNIHVINAANKNNLVTITSWLNNPEPGPHNTALSMDRRFLFVTDEIGGPVRQLKIWNIEDLFNPVLSALWQPTGITESIVHNVEVYGNYALIAHYTAGVRLIDITNPALPVEIAWYDTYPANNEHSYDGCWGVYALPSGKIIASDRETGLYVLRASVGTIGVNQNGAELPSGYELRQNYPNPFNPVTKIEYSIPKNEYVTIKIFDVTGKFCGVLIDKFEASGSHSVVYDASGLSSGVYIYKIEAGDYTESKKMMLIK